MYDVSDCRSARRRFVDGAAARSQRIQGAGGGQSDVPQRHDVHAIRCKCRLSRGSSGGDSWRISIAANTPPARQVRFDNGSAVLEGSFSEFQGIDALYCPRRTILDKLLVDAARLAGAEVRENFIVEDMLFEDGRVVGMRGRGPGGISVSEKARLVIGADGKHSMVAKAVRPESYHEVPAVVAGLLHVLGRCAAEWRRNVWTRPTHDRGMADQRWSGHHVHRVADRRVSHLSLDIEGNVLRHSIAAGSLGERIRAGKRVERFVGTADLPNYFRKPYGPGWALVGDAGLVKDPITGQGIGDAFRDAELLVEAIDAGYSGRQPLDGALAGYQQKRDELELPMYQFTTQLATFAPPKIEEQVLFAALQHNQAATNQFFGMLTGAVPMPEFFAPKNLFKIVGVKGDGQDHDAQAFAERGRHRSDQKRSRRHEA